MSFLIINYGGKIPDKLNIVQATNPVNKKQGSHTHNNPTVNTAFTPFSYQFFCKQIQTIINFQPRPNILSIQYLNIFLYIRYFTKNGNEKPASQNTNKINNAFIFGRQTIVEQKSLPNLDLISASTMETRNYYPASHSCLVVTKSSYPFTIFAHGVTIQKWQFFLPVNSIINNQNMVPAGGKFKTQCGILSCFYLGSISYNYQVAIAFTLVWKIYKCFNYCLMSRPLLIHKVVYNLHT
eukprot:TRINITY_DN5532_c0_g1_i3.p1 TRINITY_DN5532_c0_g1~~TRINITY_DN5532_c0_g1_i3.p1  ORF type:complete len:260 (+),score=-18.16 TRINITY_DN5532_c0_g1_i3:69-782(+)